MQPTVILIHFSIKLHNATKSYRSVPFVDNDTRQTPIDVNKLNHSFSLIYYIIRYKISLQR